MTIKTDLMIASNQLADLTQRLSVHCSDELDPIIRTALERTLRGLNATWNDLQSARGHEGVKRNKTEQEQAADHAAEAKWAVDNLVVKTEADVERKAEAQWHLNEAYRNIKSIKGWR